MKICVCLDIGDINICQFGNNYLIQASGVDISLTKEAALELLSDLNNMLNGMQEEVK